MIIVAEDKHLAVANKYRDSLVFDSVTGHYYLYDCQGTWALLCGNCGGDIVVPADKNEFQAFDNQGSFPAVGDLDTLYYSAAGNALFIWDGVTYVPITGGVGISTPATGNSNNSIISGNNITEADTGIRITTATCQNNILTSNRIRGAVTPIVDLGTGTVNVANNIAP